MMKKQLSLGLCLLALAACNTGRTGQKNATLADMFVWGQDEAPKTAPVKVKYIEQPEYDAPYAAKAENVEVKYVEVEPQTVPATTQQELVVSDYDGEAASYSVAKRGERYETAKYVITPQVYSIVASRAVNKMLVDVPAIFADKKDAPLFIEDTVYIDRYMPVSPDVAGKTAKDILHGSGMFNITDKRENAQYILKSSLNNVNTPEIPVFFYELKLYDAANKLHGKWSDSIREVQNDDGSWW